MKDDIADRKDPIESQTEIIDSYQNNILGVVAGMLADANAGTACPTGGMLEPTTPTHVCLFSSHPKTPSASCGSTQMTAFFVVSEMKTLSIYTTRSATDSESNVLTQGSCWAYIRKYHGCA